MISRRRLTGVFLAGSLALAAVPAAAGPLEGEGKVVADFLVDAVQEGYRLRDADRVLGAYDEGAKVISRVKGETDLAAFAHFLRGDLKSITVSRALLEIPEEGVTIDGGEAVVTARLVVEGKTIHGREISRNEKVFWKLRRSPAGWRILLQGYRPDFTTGTIDRASHGK